MYIISAPMSPVFGLLVDKVGKNIIWVLCAVLSTLGAHILLAFTFWNPWIAMVTSPGDGIEIVGIKYQYWYPRIAMVTPAGGYTSI